MAQPIELIYIAEKSYLMKDAGWSGLSKLNHLTGIGRQLEDRQNGILMFHSIGEGYGNPDVQTYPVERFRRDIQELASRYELVDLPTVFDTGPEKRVALTFDDGYQNFYRNVYPVLRELEVPATVFVVAGLLNQPDSSKSPLLDGYEQAPSLMSLSQVREVAEQELITIGNHTMTHASLTELRNQNEIEAEIIEAKRLIERLVGTEVSRFCYPGGKYNKRIRDVVATSHDLAVSVETGLVTAQTDPYALPRIEAAQDPALRDWELTDTSFKLFQVYQRINRYVG